MLTSLDVWDTWCDTVDNPHFRVLKNTIYRVCDIKLLEYLAVLLSLQKFTQEVQSVVLVNDSVCARMHVRQRKGGREREFTQQFSIFY